MLGVSGPYIHEVIKDDLSEESHCQLMLEKQGVYVLRWRENMQVREPGKCTKLEKSGDGIGLFKE